MRISSRIVLLVCAVSVGCDGPTGADDAGDHPADAGGDASTTSDGGVDASVDAATDAALDASVPGDAWVPLDGELPDGGPPDGGPADGGPADAGPPVDGGVPIELLREGWCAPLAQIACADRYACGCGGDRGPPDLATCLDDEITRCVTGLEDRIGRYLGDGNVRVDASALETCGRRVAASFAACSASRDDLPQFCLGILVASHALGEGCFINDALCAGGAGSCVSGFCEHLPLLGESCADFGQCAAGSVCRADVCVALAAEGEACARDGHCAGDLLCVDGACRPSRAAIGAACTDTPECVAGAACEGATCAVSSVRTCASDAECPSLSTCVARRGDVCQDRAALGSPCSRDDMCVAGAYCDTSVFPSVCAALLGPGQPCPLGTRSCDLTTICDGSLSPAACRLAGGLGEACAFDLATGRDGCAADLACVSGFCAAAPGSGELCAEGFECAAGLACRIDSISFERRCTTPAAEGEPCASFGERNECADGLFCDGATSTCARQRSADEICAGSPHECHDGLTCTAQPDGSMRCATMPGRGEPCSGVCADALVCADGVIEAACQPTVCDVLPGGR